LEQDLQPDHNDDLLTALTAPGQLQALMGRFEKGQQAWEASLLHIQEGQMHGLYNNFDAVAMLGVIADSFEASLRGVNTVEQLAARMQEILRSGNLMRAPDDAEKELPNIRAGWKQAPESGERIELLQKLAQEFRQEVESTEVALTHLEAGLSRLLN